MTYTIKDHKGGPLFALENGDLLFIRDRFSLIGSIIRNAQGDFDWSHVCSYWNGKIYTTGARWDWRKMAFVFGTVDPQEYLSKRAFAVGRRIDLNSRQLAACFDIMEALAKKAPPYAVSKVIRLAVKGRTSAGVVNQLHDPPKLKPDKFFCAQVEAYRLMKVGATVNSKYPNKLESAVHTPETLFDAPETQIIFVAE